MTPELAPEPMNLEMFGGNIQSHHIDISTTKLDKLKAKMQTDALTIIGTAFVEGSASKADSLISQTMDKLDSDIENHNNAEDQLEEAISGLVAIQNVGQNSLKNNVIVRNFAGALEKNPGETVQAVVDGLTEKAQSNLDIINKTNNDIPSELQGKHETNLSPLLEEAHEKHRLANRSLLEKIYEWLRDN